MLILIRADASPEIGTGHIMRCLALAQNLQHQHIKPVFVCVNLPPQLATRLTSENIDFILINEDVASSNDAQTTIKLSRKYQCNCIIVDGYQFDYEYQKRLKQVGLKVLFFDDYGHCKHYCADLILNQNLGANESLYLNRESYTQLLLGTNYTLLRKEFWQWRKWQRYINPLAKKILVTLGGADPDNITFKVLQALSLFKQELEIIVIVGASNPNYEQLSSFCKSLNLNITLKKNVTSMPELMAWADIAVAAGGSTNWELAFMGLPSIILTIADNQQEIAHKLGEMGLTISLGWHENVTVEMIKDAIAKFRESPEQRYQMSKQGRKLIDGYGSSRVLEKMGLINDQKSGYW